MRILAINLNNSNALYSAGRIGEHNATTLIIIPPEELAREADYYRVAFEVGGSVVYSEEFRSDCYCLSLQIWQELTQSRQLPMTLNGYTDNNTLIGKSSKITLLFKDAVSEPPISGEPQGMAIEVAKNTAARHAHQNIGVIDGFSEDGSTLLWNGEPVGTKAEVYDSYFDLPETAEIGTQALVKVYEDERMSDVENAGTYDKLYLKPTINLEKLERMLESNEFGFEILIGEDREIVWAGDKSFPVFPPKTLMVANENGLPIYLLFAEPIPKGIMEDVFTLQGIPLENLTIPTPVLFGWYSVDFGFINDNFAIALTRGEPYVFEDGGYVSMYGDLNGEELFIKYVLNSEPWDDYQGRFMGYWNMVYSDIGWVKI